MADQDGDFYSPLTLYCDPTSEINTKRQRLLNDSIRYTVGARWDENITPHTHNLGWLSTE